MAFGPLFPTALYREQTTRNLTQPNSQQTLTITGGQINQDPPYTQKPIYYTFFANHIWSLLLCSPVTDEYLTTLNMPSKKFVRAAGPVFTYKISMRYY